MFNKKLFTLSLVATILLIMTALIFHNFFREKNYSENMEAFISSAPETKDFNITIRTSKNEYRIGEEINVILTSTKDCYLFLVAFDSNNNADVIIPNKTVQNSFFEAGVHTLKFYATGPKGLEKFKAIATIEKKTPFHRDFLNDFYSIKKNTEEGQRDIKILADMFSEDRDTGWAVASLEINILKGAKEIFLDRGANTIIKKPNEPEVPIKTPQDPIDGMGTLGKSTKPHTNSQEPAGTG